MSRSPLRVEEGHRKILIVDDERTFTHLVKLNLEGTGHYDVWEDNEGTTALEKARAVKPDVILLDLVMLKTLGSAIAFDLHADRLLRNTPIIFVTAALPKEEMAPHRKFGGYPFLVKPVSTQEIIDCTEANLSPPVSIFSHS